MSIVKDKATAFKHEMAGSTTNKIVCKASSHELAGPKKKHVDYLIQLTSDPKCSMPTVLDMITDRSKNSSWVVVLKLLVTTHNLMTLGNEKFLQCFVTRSALNLETFSDRTDLQATDMSVFVRRYCKYINQLCTSYRALAMDVCRIPRGENSPFRKMDAAKLLKTTGVLKEQLDCLTSMDFEASDLTNGVINTCFLMLYKDLMKLYSSYSDAIVNLLELFFEMKRSQCKEVIDVYRSYLTRDEGVKAFFQLAEDVGMEKSAHSDLCDVPTDLLPALETHLSEMDSAKKSSGVEASPVIRAASEKLAQLRSREAPSIATTSASAATAAPPNGSIPTASSEVLEAQKKRFEELKQRALLKAGGGGKTDASSPEKTSSSTKLVSSSSTSTSKTASNNMDELLALGGAFGANTTNVQQPFGSGTNNPWGDFSSSSSAVEQSGFPQSAPSSNPFQQQQAPPTTAVDPWGSKASSGYQEVDLFSEIRGPDFDSVFGQQQLPQMQPQSQVASSSFAGGGAALVQSTPPTSTAAFLGDVLQPMAVGPPAPAMLLKEGPALSVLTSDVESSLARAAANLDLGSTSNTGLAKKTEHQWKPVSASVKTGGPNWQKQQIQPKTLPSQSAEVPKGGAPVNWSSGQYGGYFPSATPAHPAVPAGPMMMGGTASYQPFMMLQPPVQQQPPMMQPNMGGASQPVAWQQHPVQNQFGTQSLF